MKILFRQLLVLLLLAVSLKGHGQCLSEGLEASLTNLSASLERDEKLPVYVYPIASFPLPEQRRLMKWVFVNEKLEWKDKGGDELFESSAEDYMEYLDSNLEVGVRDPFPGYIVTKAALSPSEGKIRTDQVVGYYLGVFEFEDELTPPVSGVHRPIYEVVTTFIHKDYRKRNLAVLLGLSSVLALKKMGVERVLQETRKGGLEAILKAVNALMAKSGLDVGSMGSLIQGRNDTYDLSNGEQFESYYFNIKDLK